jgi:hypothetical protein
VGKEVSMANIYLVTHGSYSDYSIVGAFSTEANAEEFRKRVCPEGEIEPYEVDDWLPQIRDGLRLFTVRMAADGTVEKVEESNAGVYDDPRYHLEKTREQPSPEIWYGKVLLVGYMFARDEKHAVKIMNDRRTQYLATHPPSSDR